MRQTGILQLVQETLRSWSKDKAPRLAAALAYYTVLSIAPLLVVVIATAGFVIGGNTAARAQVLAEVQARVGPQVARLVDGLIENAARPGSGLFAGAVSLVTLLLGATGVFIQLKDALNTVWGVAPKAGSGLRRLLAARLTGLVMVLGLGFLLLASLVISTGLAVLSEYCSGLLGESGALALVINYAVQLAAITLLFAALFKGLPDVILGWRDVLGGALVTAVLFLAGQYGIGLYLTKAAPASAYGAAGSLVVLLLWVYYSAQIFLLGAEFTRVSYRARGKEIVPRENSRQFDQGGTGRRGSE